MINLKSIIFLTFTFFSTLTYTISAQDVAMSSINYPLENSYNNKESAVISPLIVAEKFTYKAHGEVVLVVFEDNIHTEYYSDNKYIKSKVSWKSNNECLMTVLETNLPSFPFEIGTTLTMKITKIKGKNVFYESTLAGRTWAGKMKKVK